MSILGLIGKYLRIIKSRINELNQRLETIEALLFPDTSDIDGGGADAHLVTNEVVDGGAVVIAGYFTEINGGDADL